MFWISGDEIYCNGSVVAKLVETRDLNARYDLEYKLVGDDEFYQHSSNVIDTDNIENNANCVGQLADKLSARNDALINVVKSLRPGITPIEVAAIRETLRPLVINNRADYRLLSAARDNIINEIYE